MTDRYEIIIGMEIHAELATQTKMFCACSNSPFESAANTNVCPLCLGLPGTLPVMNKQAVEWTVDLGADVGATIAEFTKWDRKNYMYPDLPKGYQISQYDLPLLSGGAIEFKRADGELVRINLTRIHLEEDTGKLLHSGSESLVDYNRSGVPLLELVTEPELHSAEDAKRFCQTYQTMLQRRGIARADMEKGELRCEANISVRKVGQTDFGTKVEVKNLNSFRSVERAIEYEVKRQIAALESGETITQETRGWDDGLQQTYVMRRKETAADYRYFPEPDLPPVTPAALWDLAAKERAAESYPHEVAGELMHEYGLTAATAELFANDATALAIWAELREELPEHSVGERAVLNQAATMYANVDVARALNVPQLASLARLVIDGTISKSQIREVAEGVLKESVEPKEYVARHDLGQTSDTGALEVILDEVLVAHADVVAKYRAGKVEVFGFLIGQAMRAAHGKANPALINHLLKQKLEGK
ncbi:Asp-tRNA(Asn)/Glu-tRNA(Gln) amidotransferase subunit GatB [Candidatus Berkelbacteria bacterium]|nr:Asp-tRNA(Asn)/Glu-tRNA(Gln) amidotransferase subunit GatB [Candidatus Berkelbacteria bacterium]